MAESKSSGTRRRWIPLISCSLLVFVIAAHSIWSFVERRRFEGMLAAIQKRGEPILASDFNVPPISPELNAGVDIEAAFSLLNTQNPAWELFDKAEDDEFRLPLIDSEKQVISDIAKVVDPAIQRLELAGDKKLAQPAIAVSSPAIAVLLPNLNPSRTLAESLKITAMNDHELGHDQLALHRLEQMRLVSRYVDLHPALVSHLVATGINVLAANTAQQLSTSLRIGNLPGQAAPADVRRVIDLLLDEKESNLNLRRAFQAERMMQADTIQCIVSGNPAAARSGLPLTNLHPALQYLLLPMTYANGSRMLRYMNDVVPASTIDNWPHAASQVPTRPVPSMFGQIYYLIANTMMPSLNRAAESSYRAYAEQRLAAISLAIRWYASEHDGKLPPTLESLVPTYLPSVPLDPMSGTNNPLQYKPVGPTPILYSVGVDGIDNGGDATATQKRLTREAKTNPWLGIDCVIPLYEVPRPATQPASE